MNYMAQRARNYGTTIFFEMTELADRHKAVNLGQGFPDFPSPDFVKMAAIKAVIDNINQYAPGRGHTPLREAIANKMADHYGLAVDPSTEVIVTHGATEAIFACILSLVDPGDEVILFEPFYDSYLPAVQIAGGVPRFYTLRPPNWIIDERELAALFTTKSKLILINTPHNPTGKVFKEDELRLIAGLCQKYDVIALSDEVYEHIIFDGRTHSCMASLPGMASRTITVSSVGKTFSVTGWKVGWAIAAPELIQALFRIHQFMIYCGAAPLQAAVAMVLQAPMRYYEELSTMYQAKRDFLVNALRKAGLSPIIPSGTYFIMVDISSLNFRDDLAFCRHLTMEVGVAAIPPSAFYHVPAEGAQLARFAFCKTNETLEEAARRLMNLNR